MPTRVHGAYPQPQASHAATPSTHSSHHAHSAATHSHSHSHSHLTHSELKRLRQNHVDPPPGGLWCDRNLSLGRQPRVGLSSQELLREIRASDHGTSKDHADDHAILQRCSSLRDALVKHMATAHRLGHATGNMSELLEFTAMGGGLASTTSQGSTSVAQFSWWARAAMILARRRERDGLRTTTVCETGFNWGTSSLAALCASPHTRVYSFDLRQGYRTSVDTQQKPLIFSAAAWLKATFPDRLTLTLGDSLNDVPMLWRRLRPDGMRPQARLLDDFPEACDLTLVDGGHDLRFAYPDMRNFRCAARVGSLMVADDCDYSQKTGKPGPPLAYKRMVSEGRVRHVEAVNFTAYKQTCVGEFA
jgi:hypothetical protein